MGSFIPTPRTTLKRLPKRGVFDREQVYGILDEAFICHVGFNDETRRPVVIPTAFGREGDRLYLHGSAASRMLRGLSGGLPVCVTATLVDGLVLARSVFHHSINYRSVVMMGEARPIAEPEAKNEGLRIITEHLVPGRWADARPPTDQELKATAVLSLNMEEVSAKVRTGGPVDDAEDLTLPVWAGVVPLHLASDAPRPDVPEGAPEMEAPAYAAQYRRAQYRRSNGHSR